MKHFDGVLHQSLLLVIHYFNPFYPIKYRQELSLRYISVSQEPVLIMCQTACNKNLPFHIYSFMIKFQNTSHYELDLPMNALQSIKCPLEMISFAKSLLDVEKY